MKSKELQDKIDNAKYGEIIGIENISTNCAGYIIKGIEYELFHSIEEAEEYKIIKKIK